MNMAMKTPGQRGTAVTSAVTLVLAVAALTPAAIAAKAGQTRDRVVAMAEARFKRFDANNDGTLTSAEVATSLQARAASAGKTFRPQMATRLFGRMDANGDGKVTLDEAKASAASRFDAADLNKNGTIDANEAGGRTAAETAEGE